MVDLTSSQQVKGFHVELVADALLVRAGRGDQEEQRLFTGVTGTFGKDIVEFPVWLGMNLIQNKTRHVQAVFRSNFSRQDLIKSCVPVVHNALRSRHDLAPFQKCRGHLHHLVGNIKNDGCLLAVSCSTIDFGRWLIIGKKQIQGHRSGKLGFSVFLADFDISRAKLTVPFFVHDAEHIPDDLLLPRKQPEPLSCPLTFGVSEVLNKGYCPICFCGIVMAAGKHEPTWFIVLQFWIVFRSALCHQLPPPPSRFSISSVASAGPPSEAMMRLREDGVRPNCSANLFMIFR